MQFMIHTLSKIMLIILNFIFLIAAALTYGPTQAAEENKKFFKKEGRLSFIEQNSHQTFKIIDIEIANNHKERAEGLMGYRSLSDSQGMFFIYPKEKILSFWMKNTLIPLDIIFINKSQQIVKIHPNAVPMNETSILSKKPASYALEVNAGFCARHAIVEGDKIEFEKIFQ